VEITLMSERYDVVVVAYLPKVQSASIKYALSIAGFGEYQFYYFVPIFPLKRCSMSTRIKKC
jgi:hypothetical protein